MKSTVLLFLVYVSQDTVGALDTNWWKHTEIYDIEVAAYKDHDGDGFGDLQGLTSKLDYIKGLGFNSIKLSPIYSSVQIMTSEYGIYDFREIHVTSGIMQDFDEFMAETRSKDMKVILDFIINDCSTSHEWFEKSRQRIDPYTDYFIWRDFTKKEKRMGATESDNWKWDRIRNQLFFRQRGNNADLNLRNEAVKLEVKELVKFWFDKGIAGLNLLKANLYIEDPLIMKKLSPSRALIENYPESYEFIHELREFVDEYSKRSGDFERILIVDQVSNPKYDNLRGNETYPIAHIVSSNVYEEVFSDFWDGILYNSDEIRKLIQYVTRELKNGPSLFMSENSETSKRLGGVFKDEQLLDTWIMSLFMNSGILHVFYGQEIGLYNLFPDNSHFYDNSVIGTSMHWDNSINAGFTRSSFSMLYPNVNYWRVNVEVYKKEELSILHMIEDLLKLRRTKAIKYGDLRTYDITEFVFAFTRSYKDEESYLVIFNFANVVHSVTLNTILDDIPDQVQVAASTPNASPQKGGEVITKLPLQLRPASGIVIDLMKTMER